MNILILVADASRARFFTTAGTSEPLQEAGNEIHALSRVQGSHFEGDAPGRTFDSKGGGRHAMEPGSDFKHHEAQVFAKQVAEDLQQRVQSGDVSKLYLVAAPNFLGLLRDEMRQQVRDKVVLELDKDLTRHEMVDIRAALPEHL